MIPCCRVSASSLTHVRDHSTPTTAVLELDFAIDRTGKVAPLHEARYREFGAWITSCYGTPVAETMPTNGSSEVTLALPAGAVIDRVQIREDQSQGQRVRSFQVEVQVGSAWQPFITGTGVGNRYIGVAPANVTGASALRLTVTGSIAPPQLAQFAAFAPCPTS